MGYSWNVAEHVKWWVISHCVWVEFGNCHCTATNRLSQSFKLSVMVMFQSSCSVFEFISISCDSNQYKGELHIFYIVCCVTASTKWEWLGSSLWSSRIFSSYGTSIFLITVIFLSKQHWVYSDQMMSKSRNTSGALVLSLSHRFTIFGHLNTMMVPLRIWNLTPIQLVQSSPWLCLSQPAPCSKWFSS